MPKFLVVESNKAFVDANPGSGPVVSILHFLCPACKDRHAINDDKEAWKFNGNFEEPTVTPSILVTWTEGEDRIEKRCHSYITTGFIQYMGDSTHELKGQTVELPQISEDKFFIKD